MLVDPSVRGFGLGLRLMREAQHALGSWGLLVILKVHSEGDKLPNTALKLAPYDQSDEQPGFKPVSQRNRPGWLVGAWHEPAVNESVSTFFYLA